MDYEWNGNVRELQNTIERLILTVPAQQIEIRHLPEKLFLSIPSQDRGMEGNVDLKEEVEQFEKHLIIRALETTSTMKEASKKLGVDASTISRKVRKYNINIAKMQYLL